MGLSITHSTALMANAALFALSHALRQLCACICRLVGLLLEVRDSAKQQLALPSPLPLPPPSQAGISVTWQGYLPACLLLCSTVAAGTYILTRSRRQQ